MSYTHTTAALTSYAKIHHAQDTKIPQQHTTSGTKLATYLEC